MEAIPLWLAGTNAWIVSSTGAGGECVLVDAPPEPAAILTRIAHHGLRLVALLATHGHADHVGGIKTVVAATPEPVPVHLHDGDRHMLLDRVATGGSIGAALEVDGEVPLLFSGDHLFQGSIGRTDLPGGSQQDLLASMAEKILPLDGAVLVLPGHGPSTTVGRERRLNPFLVGLERPRR